LIATQDENYGLGGSTSGRVSGVTAEENNPYAALYNPALISFQPGSLFAFSTSMAGASYGSLGNVVVDSPSYPTQSGVPVTSNFTPPPMSVLVWAAGFTYPFQLPSWTGGRRAGLGITLSGPYEKLRSFSAGTPYDFYSLRYGGDDSQFKATVALSGEIIPDYLSAGAGLSVFITAAGSSEANLVTQNPTGRLNLDVGLNTAAIAGLYGKALKTGFAFTFRQGINPTFQQQFVGQVQIARGTGTMALPVVVSSTLYFEPSLFELEAQREFGLWKVSAGVSYQMWSQYNPSFLIVQAQDAGQQTASTNTPSLQLNNTVNPRASVETTLLSPFILSAGYQFRPSPLSDQTASGPSNILDTDAHIVGFSVTHKIPKNEIIPLPLSWGLFAQYHFLTTRQITKQDPGFVGGPEYSFGGNAYTYGLWLQAEL
jgi:hypothetical protein